MQTLSSPMTCGKAVTDRDIAKLAGTQFEPWTPVPDECTPRALLETCDLPAQTAYALMLRSKADLVDLLRDVGIEQHGMLVAEIVSAAEKLKSIAAMMDAAVARLVASVATEASGTWEDRAKIPKIALPPA
jgi:hypothetical protein